MQEQAVAVYEVECGELLDERATAEHGDHAAAFGLHPPQRRRQVSVEDPGVRPRQLGIVEGAGDHVLRRGVEVRRHRVGLGLLRPERRHLLVGAPTEQVRARRLHALECGRPLHLVAVGRALPAVRETAVPILVR